MPSGASRPRCSGGVDVHLADIHVERPARKVHTGSVCLICCCQNPCFPVYTEITREGVFRKAQFLVTKKNLCVDEKPNRNVCGK